MALERVSYIESHSEQLGREYLVAQPIADKLALGQVYTPAYIARFVLECSEFGSDNKGLLGPLLDPACGSGVFLEQATCILHRAISTKSPRSNLDPLEFAELVRHYIWGIDVDANACELARLSLVRCVSQLVGREIDARYFDANILRSDFLQDDGVLRFGSANGAFSFIVGNPPYISTERLRSRQKAALRKKYVSAHGRIDLYALFMERAIALLSPSGRMSFITPDKFLTSRSAAPLRSLFSKSGKLRVLARFNSHRVFGGAAIVPCVSVFEKQSTGSATMILECVADHSAKKVSIGRRSKEFFELSSDSWNFNEKFVTTLLEELSQPHPNLGEVALRISAGPATGRDRLFMIEGEMAKCIEPELLSPCIRGRDISPFSVESHEKLLLVPYLFRGKKTEPISLTDFPGAAEYLETHREELRARHCVIQWGKAWYEYHDTPPVDFRRIEKIVVPDVAENNRFALDSSSFPLHSTYYILLGPEIDRNYLLAVLNSRVATFYLRMTSPRVKDGFSRYRQQFLKLVPIPIIDLASQVQVSKSVERREFDEVEEMVFQAFGLSRAQRRAIDRFVGNATSG